MKKLLLCIITCLTLTHSYAIQKRVLFIGNSYTYVNDLPLMLKNVAASVNDTVIYDSYAPGGYTFQQHSADPTTINKIMLGNWDYIVLQEQSQRPSFPINQVETQVFPYARKLDSFVRHYNPCAETIFYMTWGYENGDVSNCANFPPLCTYRGMDSLIRLRYEMMADSNNAILAPVGAVRRYLRTNNPTINLYDTDGSHPSLGGTYAAACTFYATIFRKNPLNITFNAGLAGQQATDIRTAAKLVAFDSLLKWHIGEYDPTANFTYSISGNTLNCTNQSANASSYSWTFGDGGTSNQPNPSHTYATPGVYSVRLIASSCGQLDTIIKSINTSATSIQDIDNSKFKFYPNPVSDMTTLELNGNPVEKVSLTTLQGKAIYPSCKINSDHISIDLSDYPAGIYFVRVTIKGQEIVRKIVKE